MHHNTGFIEIYPTHQRVQNTLSTLCNAQVLLGNEYWRRVRIEMNGIRNNALSSCEYSAKHPDLLVSDIYIDATICSCVYSILYTRHSAIAWTPDPYTDS